MLSIGCTLSSSSAGSTQPRCWAESRQRTRTTLGATLPLPVAPLLLRRRQRHLLPTGRAWVARRYHLGNRMRYCYRRGNNLGRLRYVWGNGLGLRGLGRYGSRNGVSFPLAPGALRGLHDYGRRSKIASRSRPVPHLAQPAQRLIHGAPTYSAQHEYAGTKSVPGKDPGRNPLP